MKIRTPEPNKGYGARIFMSGEDSVTITDIPAEEIAADINKALVKIDSTRYETRQRLKVQIKNNITAGF
jgi:hypothetical protein